MIRAVIFDLGGVVLDTTPFLARISEVFQPDNPEQFWEDVNQEAASACRGDISLLELWGRVARKAGKDIPEDVLRGLWVEDYDPEKCINTDVVTLIKKLRKDCKVAVLSNTIPEHTDIHRMVGIFEPFDVVILSHEVGMAKDQKEIFLLTAERLGVSPEECVFIDDVCYFVEVAQSVGMKGIVFSGAEDLKRELEGLL
ncbi:MAG: HAD family phosphatase [Candidatus Methanofastidiosia archaeon]